MVIMFYFYFQFLFFLIIIIIPILFLPFHKMLHFLIHYFINFVNKILKMKDDFHEFNFILLIIKNY